MCVIVPSLLDQEAHKSQGRAARFRGIPAMIDYPAMGPPSLLVLAAPPLQREGCVRLGAAL